LKPGRRSLETTNPGERRAGEDTSLVLFRVLAKIPDISTVILREKRELRLGELALLEVLIPQNSVAHAIQYLGQIGDGKHDGMSSGPAPVVCRPFKGELRIRSFQLFSDQIDNQ